MARKPTNEIRADEIKIRVPLARIVIERIERAAARRGTNVDRYCEDAIMAALDRDAPTRDPVT